MIPIPSKAGAASNSLVSGEVVRAPMPGNVLKMEVAQGQEVEERDLLLVLEAMKETINVWCRSAPFGPASGPASSVP